MHLGAKILSFSYQKNLFRKKEDFYYYHLFLPSSSLKKTLYISRLSEFHWIFLLSSVNPPVSNVRRRKLFRIQCRRVLYYTHTHNVGRSIILLLSTHRLIHHHRESVVLWWFIGLFYTVRNFFFLFFFLLIFWHFGKQSTFWSITNGALLDAPWAILYSV